MKHPLLICGYGPAIAHSLARRFGKAGHPVALVARNAQRLADGVLLLQAEGIRAQGFVADLADTAALYRVIAEVQAIFGPIGILHWNAFADVEGNLLTTSPDTLAHSLAVRVVGFIAAVQATLNDLEANQGAVLATNGIMACNGQEIDALSQNFSALAISAAAQHKALGVLTPTLAARGVYVGEVIVNGFVKNSAGAEHYDASVDPEDISEQFWDLQATRTTHSVIFGGALFTGVSG